MAKTIEYDKSAGVTSVTFHGAIIDTHSHPRLFDPLFPGQPEMPNGKAGLSEYSRAALRGGFSLIDIMPNELARLYDPAQPDLTKLSPFPITNLDRLQAAITLIYAESYTNTGIIFGVDPEALDLVKTEEVFDRTNLSFDKIRRNFSHRLVRDYTVGLKIYGGETTGGYAIPLDLILPVAKIWHEYNALKPVVLHLEDEAVAQVLADWPSGVPVHIAHVSSRQELDAVIDAKERDLRVTCEVTPHHFFLTSATREEIGAFGCMKPSLKSEQDRQYLRDNLDYVDTFASDCAPHRRIDKVGIDGYGRPDPAYGVTNHAEFMPLFFGAIEEGLMTDVDLYRRVVIRPREIFNHPLLDVRTRYMLRPISATQLNEKVAYGHSPFIKSSETPLMVGHLESIYWAGRLAVRFGQINEVVAGPSYHNLIGS